MNPQQAENLRILIRHMETKVTRTLSMDAITGPCGTPACAFGEAACMPHFNALGLVALPKSSFCSVAWHGKETMLARKVLAEHGYTMDDGFAAFKAKILAPLAEGVPCWPEV
jgi:hypothetical protein